MANDIFNTKKLGFGLMRLPKKPVLIDVDQTAQMTDLFLEAGFTYFDTAYVYIGSETAARKARVERHPRESYTLASKLNAGIAPTAQAAKRQLSTTLKRTGAGYIDYYLLHCLMESNVEKYEKFGLWDFVKEQKAKGKIRHFGFSFHDSPQLLDEILTKHPEAEFVQLQINYLDWEDPKVASRANYEVARKHDKPIIVMEPVKGGKLADPPEEVKALMRAYAPEASPASWAIRFAASLPGVVTVLSGMSNVEQMQDNLSYMADFRPLNDEEREVIRKAQEIMGRSAAIPCTACAYCTENCPMSIPIPEIFAAANRHYTAGQTAEAKAAYAAATEGRGRATDCIECRQCEGACPQHLEITGLLKKSAALLEETE